MDALEPLHIEALKEIEVNQMEQLKRKRTIRDYKMKKDSVDSWMKREMIVSNIEVKSIVFDNIERFIYDILSDKPINSKKKIKEISSKI